MGCGRPGEDASTGEFMRIKVSAERDTNETDIQGDVLASDGDWMAWVTRFGRSGRQQKTLTCKSKTQCMQCLYKRW